MCCLIHLRTTDRWSAKQGPLQRDSSDKYISLQDWVTHASLFPSPQWNHLQLAVKGSTILVFLNGQVAVQLDDSSIEAGWIRLITSNSSDSDTDGRFDNLEVYICDDDLELPDFPQVPPMPRFDYAPTDPNTVTRVQFDASTSFAQTGLIHSYAWDFGDGKMGAGMTIGHTFSTPGQYTVRLTVTDSFELTASEAKTIIVVSSNKQPTASFTWHALSSSETRLVVEPRTGDRIEFDASDSSDPDGDIVEYAWDWDSNGSYDSTTTDPVIEHAFSSSGSHRVMLCVTDDVGDTATVTKTISIGANQSPNAAFTFTPSSPSILDTVQFTDTSTDPDGPVVSWRWDFGDGDTSIDQYPTHIYTESGTYTVSLMVTDNDGATGGHEEEIIVAAVPAVVEPHEVWSLVVGVSTHQDPSLDLQYTRTDAEAIHRWLIETAGVPEDHTRLLTDSQATFVEVRDGLEWLRRHAGSDDLVIFFFAGHGYQGTDLTPVDEDDGLDEYFVLYDTKRSSIEATALRDDDFGIFLDRLESQHVLVIFDSCYSGGQSRGQRGLPRGARPVGDTFDLWGDFQLDGRLILSGSTEDQLSWESADLGQGVFTYFLLQGLGGEADADEDGHVTAQELFDYAAAEVSTYVREQLGAEQQPEMIGQGIRQIVIAQGNQPPEVAFAIDPEVPYTFGPTHFTDASTDDTSIISWQWDFGEGTTSTEENPTHTYQQAGSCTVTLTATDSEGASSTIEQEIVIAPPGEVTVVDGDTIIISLGSANGVKVSDRFEVLRILELSGGQTIEECKATIEVAELLGADRAACHVIELERPIEEGDVIRCEE